MPIVREAYDAFTKRYFRSEGSEPVTTVEHAGRPGTEGTVSEDTGGTGSREAVEPKTVEATAAGTVTEDIVPGTADQSTGTSRAAPPLDGTGEAAPASTQAEGPGGGSRADSGSGSPEPGTGAAQSDTGAGVARGTEQPSDSGIALTEEARASEQPGERNIEGDDTAEFMNPAEAREAAQDIFGADRSIRARVMEAIGLRDSRTLDDFVTNYKRITDAVKSPRHIECGER